jgi:hypothetical protein
MTTEDILLLLANHANLPGVRFPETGSLAWVLWNADRRRLAPDLGPIGSDPLSCLEAINLRLNGPVPSTRVGIREDSHTIAEVAYSMACILESGLRYHRRWTREAAFTQEIRDELEDLLHRVSYAWCQVLAGDMDDVLEGFDFAGQA